MNTSPGRSPELLYEGRHLRLLRLGHWEYAERVRARAAVVVIAVTPDGALLLVEQYRPPVAARVIELPAGLVGDEAQFEAEDYLAAARRELLEETGHEAESLAIVGEGPVSPGLSNEHIVLVRAWNLRRVADGGGVDDEQIIVHEVPLSSLPQWLAALPARGIVVDAKVHAGLWFAHQNPTPSET